MTAWLLAPERVQRVDVIVAAWSVAFALLAVWVWSSVSNLSDLGDSVVRVGTSVQRTGVALGDLASLPLVGDTVSGVAEQVRAAGREAVVQGRAAQDGVARTALLLGFVTFIVPVAPVAGFWLTARFGYGRTQARWGPGG